MQSKCIKIANSTFTQPDQGRWKQPNLFGGTKFPVVITRQSQHDCPLGGSNTDAVSSVLILKHSQDRPKFLYFSRKLRLCLHLPYHISPTSRRQIFRNIFEALYFVLQVSPAGRGGLGSNKRVAKSKYQQVAVFPFHQFVVIWLIILMVTIRNTHQPARYLVIVKY